MKVYINEITGLGDALVSLLMSKRSWTRQKEKELRLLIFANTHSVTGMPYKSMSEELSDQIDKLIKYGVQMGHTTLLRFIDISVTVEGLHRAGQDDWDAHAARMNNRIVRSSTRLATFSEGEKSDWYADKIKYPFEVLNHEGIEIPEYVVIEDVPYRRSDFGYVREDLLGDKDAKRGLYPLAIPSNFIFKVQYPELCHIIQHRDNSGGANPEVKEVAEAIKAELTRVFPALGENLTVLKMQP